MKNATYFDQKNISKYNLNPWDKRYKLGLYFTALSEIGDHLDLHIALKENDKFKWYKTPHALHDAYSAIETLFKEKNITLNNVLKYEHNHSLKLKSIIQALQSRPKEEHIFKNQSTLSTGATYVYSYRKIDLLKSHLSKTAIFINIIAKICMKKLTHNSQSRWMIPVRTFNKGGMSASYLGLNIKKNDSIDKTQGQLVTKLKSGEHWGFYYISMIGLFLGKWFIKTGTKKSLDKKKTRWPGSVSNLGNVGTSQDLEEFLILHPVRWHRPID